MSLNNFLKRAEVINIVKPLRPRGSRKISAPLRVEPLTTRGQQSVGTAFDYLLRFELLRRAPHAEERSWVAENARLKIFVIPSRALRAGDLREADDFDDVKAAARIDEIIGAARAALDRHLQSPAPTRLELAELAAHALRLARLDAFFRSGFLDPGFGEHEVPSEDVDDLLRMLEVVPYSELLRDGRILLNPAFGAASVLVHGADADLICGDMLIDIKVSVQGEFVVNHFDELLGYYLLARECRRVDATFPEVRHVGIYFARRGYLWTMPVSTWTSRTDFTTSEKAFVARAKARWGPRDSAHDASDADAVVQTPIIPRSVPGNSNPAQATDAAIRIGVYVEHPIFGVGVVREIGDDEDPVAVVEFPGHAPKRIKSRFLPVAKGQSTT